MAWRRTLLIIISGSSSRRKLSSRPMEGVDPRSWGVSQFLGPRRRIGSGYFDAGIFAGGLDDVADRSRRRCAMALDADHVLGLGPAAVAIHDDGHMLGDFPQICKAVGGLMGRAIVGETRSKLPNFSKGRSGMGTIKVSHREAAARGHSKREFWMHHSDPIRGVKDSLLHLCDDDERKRVRNTLLPVSALRDIGIGSTVLRRRRLDLGRSRSRCGPTETMRRRAPVKSARACRYVRVAAGSFLKSRMALMSFCQPANLR